ncbi:MAG TPA: hypothetical protein VFS00_07625 [Polyangiaceae bacterium]|nr:hypothetical protein [Polyangiaceae bacterium]
MTTSERVRRWCVAWALLVVGCAGGGAEPYALEAAGGEGGEAPAAPRAEGEASVEAEGALPAGADRRDEVHLRGEAFYPEGIAVARNGALFVGSYANGAIDRVPPGGERALPFIAPTPGTSAAGLLVDDEREALWACINDAAGVAPGVVKRYRLKTGQPDGAFPLAGGALCNDLALDAAGNLYVTESAIKTIFRLRPGGAALEPWSVSEAFGGGAITLNGIAFDGGSNLYTVKYMTHELYRVPIGPGGAAGEPVRIEVEPPIEFPDGIKAIDATTFVVAENDVGKVSLVKVSGDKAQKTVLANGLAEPTTLALVGPNVWVVEGQLSFFFGAPGSPTLPFRLRRFFLP